MKNIKLFESFNNISEGSVSYSAETEMRKIDNTIDNIDSVPYITMSGYTAKKSNEDQIAELQKQLDFSGVKRTEGEGGSFHDHFIIYSTGRTVLFAITYTERTAGFDVTYLVPNNNKK